MITLSQLEDALLFTSGSHSDGTAILIRETGQILFQSDISGIDETGDLDEWDLDEIVVIPNKYDLDLGQNLIFDFVGRHMLDDYDYVSSIFRQKSAYRRYKDFLARRGMLEKWYQYEQDRTYQALREWCEENDIELAE